MLNKTMLIGNLGADVDTRYTKTQVAVATFRIVTKASDGSGTGAPAGCRGRCDPRHSARTHRRHPRQAQQLIRMAKHAPSKSSSSCKAAWRYCALTNVEGDNSDKCLQVAALSNSELGHEHSRKLKRSWS